MNIGLWRALVWQNTPQHSIGVGLPFWLWWTRYSQIKGSLCVSDQAVQWTNSVASAYKKPCTDRIANRFQNISTQGLWEYFLGPTFALIKRVGNFENKLFAWNSAIRFPGRLKKESLMSIHGSCDNSFKKKAATINFCPLKIDDTTHFGLVWRLHTPGSHPTSTVPPPTPKHFAFHASIALTADHTGPLQRVLDQAVNHGPCTRIYHLSLAFTSRAWFAWKGSKWSRSFQVQSITPKRCTAHVPSALLTDSITASTGYGGYNLQIIPFWWKFVVATSRMLHLFEFPPI